ncbi:MAG: hypothetical protein Q7J64_02910 [Elusimicrobiota bacterium]|nr:hypothetical protein [Elusimicrobiota bacterium]
MNEDDDARLAKSAMKSLKVAAPESLKADLKRLARNRKPAPSIWAGLLESLSGGKWAYGAGAAFAAAGISVLILRAVPDLATTSLAPDRPAARLETASPQALRDLWSDDSGEDHDEI